MKKEIMTTAENTVGVKINGINRVISVGSHYVVMSGYAGANTGEIDDLPLNDDSVERKEWIGEVVIGPIWRDIHMCSPMVAPGNFYDWDNDENDVQGWMLKEGCYWEEAEVNQKKRIKLKFRMIQYGETSSFSGVVYHVAATGYVVDMESRKYLLGD